MVTRERIEEVGERVRPDLQADGEGIGRLGVEGSASTAPETAAPAGGIQSVAPIALDDRLRELETNLIDWALSASHGTKSKAAELLGVKRSTLGDRMRRCHLDRRASSTADIVTPVALAS
jgi:DNA-binding NtrC family response regulator